MTNQEIEQKLSQLVRSERKITREVIETVALAEKQKIYVARGYSCLFTYLVEYFKYSEGAADRRKNAAFALLRAPNISQKLADGSLSLTNVSKASAMIYAHEKKHENYSATEYAAIFEKLENKTTAEANKVLYAMFPESAKQESKRRISQHETKLFLTMSEEGMADLEWLKAHWSHIYPEGKFADVIARAAKEIRAKLEKQTPQETPDEQTTGQKARKIAMHRAQYKCEFVDPRTGQKCGSTYQVQVDHVIPRALGGPDTLSNMRCLCRTHNLHMAEKELGKKWANHWRPEPPLRNQFSKI